MAFSLPVPARKKSWSQKLAWSVAGPLAGDGRRSMKRVRNHSRNAALIGAVGLIAITGVWYAKSGPVPSQGIAAYGGGQATAVATNGASDAAIDLLRLRYAQGEITREQFQVMLTDVERTGGF